VRGVLATIGGDDQLRILRHLDPEVLRANPTRFYGMSDNTNLALCLWNLGIVSFYGGQLMNQVATPGFLPEYTERSLERAFFDEQIGEVLTETESPPIRWLDDDVALVRGEVNVHEVNEALGTDFPETGEYESVAGLLIRIGSDWLLVQPTAVGRSIPN